jgi:hypothetical protein
MGRGNECPNLVAFKENWDIKPITDFNIRIPFSVSLLLFSAFLVENQSRGG